MMVSRLPLASHEDAVRYPLFGTRRANGRRFATRSLTALPCECIKSKRRSEKREYFVKPHQVLELLDIARQFKSRWLSGAESREAPDEVEKTAPHV